MSSQEFYICLDYLEIRKNNSFPGDIVHSQKHGFQKFTVKWYCPCCSVLYAVTYRSWHINRCHPKGEIGEERPSPGGRPQSSDNDKSDCVHEEDEEQCEIYVPKQKRMRFLLSGGSSQKGSTGAKDDPNGHYDITRFQSVVLSNPHPRSSALVPVGNQPFVPTWNRTCNK